MKRILLCIGITFIIFLTGCKDNISKEEYVKEYDSCMYNLEKFISDDLYLINYRFLDNYGFNFYFSSKPYNQSLQQLLKILDDTMYKLDEIGPKIDDYKIQQYQSKIEYALKDIRGKINNYSNLEVTNVIKPNKSTLYNETYKLLIDISEYVIDIKAYQDKLDEYVDEYRDYDTNSHNINELKDLKIKNRLRILYTYLYTTAYIASYDDYTGLHTNPRQPTLMSFNDGMFSVYELALTILKPTVQFSKEYFKHEDIYIENNKDKDSINEYVNLLNNSIKGIDEYYKFRSRFDADFFTTNKFKKYQVVIKSHRKYNKEFVLHDFDEDIEDYDFSSMKNYYNQVKILNGISPLSRLLFSKEQVPIEELYEKFMKNRK